MKKPIALFLCIIMTFSVLYGSAFDITEEIPFQFENDVVYTDGTSVQVAGENSRGLVYKMDGTHIETINNDGEILENGYIKVTPAGTNKWTVFTTDGQRAFDGVYDIVTVTEQGLAIVGNGSMHPPGYFIGKYGAIDLITGKTILPLAYDALSLSADGSCLWANSQKPHRVFDLKGQEITKDTPFVCLSKYPNGYYKICDPKTGLFGISNLNKIVRTPPLYDQVGEIVFESAVLVCKNGKWGASSIDGSGALLQPLIYGHGASYENGMYILKRWGWPAMEDGNPLSFFYGDGGMSFINKDYDAIYGYCGDIFYVNQKSNGALVGISKTRQVVAGPFQDGYISFSHPTCDFVLIGKKQQDGSQNPQGSMVLNRWGEVIAPYGTGDLLSEGALGPGLGLYNQKTDKVTRIMADGTKLPETSTAVSVDYVRGLLIYNNEKESYMTDLFGNSLIESGIYSRLNSSSNMYYVLNGQLLRNTPKLFAVDINGKHGGLSLTDAPYEYKPHSWAQNDLDEAIQKDLVPESEQRDYRNPCNRRDFCRLLRPLLDLYDLSAENTGVFSDTDDPDVLHAAALGIVAGTGNGKFSPNRPITRQEAAVILTRAAKLLSIAPTGTPNQFSDAASFAPWAVDAISYINGVVYGEKDERIMQGVSSDRFSPRGYYTREQSILTILRLSRATP